MSPAYMTQLFLWSLMSVIFATSATFSVPVTRKIVPPNPGSAIFQRHEIDTVYNNVSLYSVDVLVGTPGQLINLQFDTGSGDTWLFGIDSDICKLKKCVGPKFNSSASSTFTLLEKGKFSVGYIGSNISGDWISDQFSFINGSVVLNQQHIGLANSGTQTTPILGIGASSSTTNLNVVNNFMHNGYINTAAYSLYMDDLTTSQGQVIFGGVDTEKFSGPLLPLPLDSQYLMTLSVNVADNMTVVMDKPLRAILDTGAEYMNLPPDAFKAFMSAINAVQTVEKGWVADCDYNCNATVPFLSYSFGSSATSTQPGPVINAPLSNFIFKLGTFKGQPWKNTCGIYISSTTGTNLFVGDAFLRNAYLVYDFTNDQISLAQTNFETTTSNISEIPKGKLPSYTGRVSGATTVPRSKFSTCGSISYTSISSSTPTSSNVLSTSSSIEQTVTVSTTSPSATSGAQANTPSSYAKSALISVGLLIMAEMSDITSSRLSIVLGIILLLGGSLYIVPI